MFSPAYQQLLQSKGFTAPHHPIRITDINRGGLGRQNIQPQTPVRQQGFGTHFKDTPPPFVKKDKEDNKIERVKKPTKKTPKSKLKSKR